MLAAAIPTKFTIPFAKNAGAGYIRAIPQASQIGIQNGAASLNDGFPPLTFVPTGAGGTPPFGQDFNGLCNQLSAWGQWQGAGGVPRYDSVFAAAIGGYPATALVASTTAGVYFINTVDNNVTNPDSGGVGWIPLATLRPTGRTIKSTPGAYSFTVPAGVHFVTLKLWGAGGGGGGSASGTPGGAASGGGSGAFGTIQLAVNPGDVITGVIGTGGAAGVAGNHDGTNGGDTTAVYNAVTYTGGGGAHGFGAAAGAQASSAAGGTPTNGDPTSALGTPSLNGWFSYNGTTSNALGSSGGTAPGLGGGQGGGAGQGPGNPGQAPGGGGGGGGYNGSPSAGGAGANGQAWFEY